MKNETYGHDGKQAFHILVCLIQIWGDPSVMKPSDPDFMQPGDNRLEIAEVESIEVVDNYKQLIGKASVKFPRGTVIRKTSTTTREVTEDARKVTATLDDHGVLLTARKSYSDVANVTDFKVGQRIRIYVGYTTDPKVAASTRYNPRNGSIFTNETLHDSYMKVFEPFGPIFDGYITRCSIDTPIELECENLASVLKKFNAPDVKNNPQLTVNDLMAPDGRYYMLGGTGMELYPATKACRIAIGAATLNRDLTVADVLTTWTKNKLYSYVWVDYSVVPAKPYIVVGRSYFTNKGKDSILQQRQDQGSGTTSVIDFNYNVAENGLTLTESNKEFLCIQGQSLEKNNKFYHMTIRINPEWKEGQPDKDKWQILNEVRLSKKMMKMGATVMSKGNNRVDLSRYTIVPYVSRKVGCTHDELLQELIAYYEDYNMNGISGTLTLFGDLQLKSGCKVRLVDPYYPAKNGVYFVDEVTTRFGTDGFRQTIKLPYCITRDSDKDK